jgi:hypothetical protein
VVLTWTIQGAEPIYLHLIRPVIKPYTRTLDAALELMLMVGDFLIALSTYPVQLAVQWWKGDLHGSSNHRHLKILLMNLQMKTAHQKSLHHSSLLVNVPYLLHVEGTSKPTKIK